MNRETSALARWVGTLALLASCSPNREVVALSDADSAGVAFVRNGLDAAQSQPRRLREVTSIGTEDAGDALRFSNIAGIAMDGIGQIYVANGGSNSVRKFAPDGHFIMEIGGRGDGPGEFRDIGPLWIAGDSILVISDWSRQGAANLYRVDGQFIRRTGFSSNRSEEVSGPVNPILVNLAAADHWVGLIDETTLRPRAPIGERRLLGKRLVELDLDSDSIGPEIFTAPPIPYYGSIGVGGLDQPLFELQHPVGFDAGGMIYFSHGLPYRIDVRDSRGRLLRVITKSVKLLPVTESLREQAVKGIVDWYRAAAPKFSADEERMFTGWLKQRADFPEPDSVPPTGAMLVSPDGSLMINRVDDPPGLTTIRWLFGYNPAFKAAPLNVYRRWDTFDPFGRYLGYLEFPRDFTPHAVLRNRIAGVATDTLGVEKVVVLEVEN